MKKIGIGIVIALAVSQSVMASIIVTDLGNSGSSGNLVVSNVAVNVGDVVVAMGSRINVDPSGSDLGSVEGTWSGLTANGGTGNTLDSFNYLTITKAGTITSLSSIAASYQSVGFAMLSSDGVDGYLSFLGSAGAAPASGSTVSVNFNTNGLTGASGEVAGIAIASGGASNPLWLNRTGDAGTVLYNVSSGARGAAYGVTTDGSWDYGVTNGVDGTDGYMTLAFVEIAGPPPPPPAVTQVLDFQFDEADGTVSAISSVNALTLDGIAGQCYVTNGAYLVSATPGKNFYRGLDTPDQSDVEIAMNVVIRSATLDAGQTIGFYVRDGVEVMQFRLITSGSDLVISLRERNAADTGYNQNVLTTLETGSYSLTQELSVSTTVDLTTGATSYSWIYGTNEGTLNSTTIPNSTALTMGIASGTGAWVNGNVLIEEWTAGVVQPEVPEGNPIDVYYAWLSGFSMGPSTNLTDDADGDLLDNLGEYAFGGAPDDNTDQGNTPVQSQMSEGGTNYLEYIYYERVDAADRGLSSILEVGTDLVNTNWTTTGIESIGSGPSAVPGYNAVTNRISTMDDAKRFLNLKNKFTQ